MFRKGLIVLVFALFTSTALFSNTTILGKHSGKMKEGEKILCNYCHQDAGIKKQKGQFKDGKLNGKKLSGMKNCNGSGCHTK